jgi:alkanesulfonate monooxygenase SsuD/methylene tetrahydromethanopterin reductase-like flavin-dependent oxidoreductase (luciferase family)
MQAWTRGHVDFAGSHFRFKDVVIKPRPLQKPHPPIWMAAVSPESFVSAGARGFNLICGPIFGVGRDYLEKNLLTYREALSSHGYDPASRQVAMLAMVYVAANESTAESDFSQQAVWCYRALSTSADSSLRATPIPSYEHYTSLRNAGCVEWKTIRESDVVIWGSPDRCIARIAELQRRLGFTTLLCWTRVGALDNRKVRDSMALMQEHVLPHFKRHAARS